MKNKKTFLAILIIVGSIFAVAFWSNIIKSPPETNIEAEKKVNIIDRPAQRSDYMDCELTLEGCKG